MVELHPQSMLRTAESPEDSKQRPPNFEYHFVDIGSYSCGSVFGVGEHMEDRSVVARDVVQCLLIPRYWLLQKPQSMNNVWSRIRIFIEQRQPSRQKLFEWYLKEVRWRRLRKQLRENVVGVRVRINSTDVGDVPTLSRIEDSDVFV